MNYDFIGVEPMLFGCIFINLASALITISIYKMIKSITFHEGGYITSRSERTVFLESGQKKIDQYKKEKSPSHWECMSDNGFIRNCRLIEDEDYKVEDIGYTNPQLVQNLLDRKMVFEGGKINVIFGPNASGKTTILKALAAYCCCGTSDNLDGWTNRFFITPHNASNAYDIFDRKSQNDDEVVEDSIRQIMVNRADVEWDGVPVYSDNFFNRKTVGSLGELSGSIFGDSGFEELHYHMEKGKMSKGQNSIFILNKITAMMQNEVSLDDILGDRKLDANDRWVSMFNANIRRLERIYGESEHQNLKNTFMFDEMDKSMDIMNVAFLYGDLLPALVKRFGVQIIIVSHSPLILTRNIYENPLYNIISMDDEYTSECLEKLKNFSFGV